MRNNKNEFVIWTMHFTTFVTYNTDKTPPEITINKPFDGAKYVLNSTVNADWSATDEMSGVDSAIGTADSGNLIDTSSVGSRSFTVTATDKAGNTVTKTVKYNVVYSFGGFQNPTTKDKSFSVNSTIPVKFQLTDSRGKYISAVVASLKVDDKEAVASGDSNGGDLFKYDATSNQYTFNLSVKNTSLGIGTHTLKIKLDDGTTYSQDIFAK
jgi:hypothetical protein